jgi:hypothetical protein
MDINVIFTPAGRRTIVSGFYRFLGVPGEFIFLSSRPPESWYDDIQVNRTPGSKPTRFEMNHPVKGIG